jgi:hypothetical protein
MNAQHEMTYTVYYKKQWLGYAQSVAFELYKKSVVSVVTIEGLLDHGNTASKGFLTLDLKIPFTKRHLELLLGTATLEVDHIQLATQPAEILTIIEKSSKLAQINFEITLAQHPTFVFDSYHWSLTKSRFAIFEYRKTNISASMQESLSQCTPLTSNATFDFYFEYNGASVPVLLQAPVQAEILEVLEDIDSIEQTMHGFLSSKQQIQIEMAPILGTKSFLSKLAAIKDQNMEFYTLNFVVACKRAGLKMRFCQLHVAYSTSDPLNTHVGNLCSYTLTSKPLIKKLIELEEIL